MAMKKTLVIILAIIASCARIKGTLEEEMFLQPQFNISTKKEKIFFVKEKDLRNAIKNVVKCVISKTYPETVNFEEIEVEGDISENFSQIVNDLIEEELTKSWIVLVKERADINLKGKLIRSEAGMDIILFLKAYKDTSTVITCSSLVKVRSHETRRNPVNP